MSLNEYKGDLLEAQVDVIAHQTNCTSNGVSGIASVIFKHHPKTNTYGQNPRRAMFGSFELFEVSSSPYKHVANIYGQLRPGVPSTEPYDDTYARTHAFIGALNGLLKTMQDKNLSSIAFPGYIGCGLAGGNWKTYSNIISAAADSFVDIEFSIIYKS